MSRSKRDLLWILTLAVLVAFAVPWFLWGNDLVVAGLPVWLWWHVGWMVLCTLVFYRFTERAWDRGMTFDVDPSLADASVSTAAGATTESADEAEPTATVNTDGGDVR